MDIPEHAQACHRNAVFSEKAKPASKEPTRGRGWSMDKCPVPQDMKYIEKPQIPGGSRCNYYTALRGNTFHSPA